MSNDNNRDPELNNTLDTRKYPDAFYCGMTKELLKDPVVAPDGNSYERSVALATGAHREDELYPNRALKEVIEEVVELNGDSIQSEMLRYRRFFRESMQGILDKTPIPSENICPLPDAYHCPITFGLIHVPVIDPEGNTFEKVAIDAWITQNNSSPITRTPQSIHDLYPNHAISSLLEYEKNKDDEFMHPSIRKFKEEEPPSAPPPTDEPSRAPARRTTRDLYPRTPAQLYAEREHLAWKLMLRKWKVTMALLLIPCYYYGGSILLVVFALFTLAVLRCFHKIRFRKGRRDRAVLRSQNHPQTLVIRVTSHGN